jgi:hypothetical protein
MRNLLQFFLYAFAFIQAAREMESWEAYEDGRSVKLGYVASAAEAVHEAHR